MNSLQMLTLASTLAVSAAATEAQTVVPQPARSAVAAEPIPSTYPGQTQRGGWAIGYSANFAQISAKGVTTSRWFVVNEAGNGPGDAVQLFVDDAGSNYPVNYGGGALVYGKTIYASKYNGTGRFSGVWSILAPAQVTLPAVVWTIFPETNKEAILGIFDAPRDFMVTFSNDRKVGDCTAGALKLIVDDKTVPDPSGNPLILAQGSTVIANGRKVRISVSGSCNTGLEYTGALQLL
jgi:hypothetical protein